jgi:hypothetical protein
MTNVTRLYEDEIPRLPKRLPIENPCLVVIVKKGGRAEKVVLSAYREFNRIERLANVAGHLPLDVLRKLQMLHDCKGDLSAVWNSCQQARTLQLFAKRGRQSVSTALRISITGRHCWTTVGEAIGAHHH